MHHRTIKVLLVEDEPLLLEMYSEFLNEAGFVVTKASNGDHAWSLICSAGAFDVLLTDVRMAGQLDGIKLAYKCQSARPAIVRILMSGYMMSDVSIEPGLARFLRKPFTSHMLVDAINRCLSENRTVDDRGHRSNDDVSLNNNVL